MGAQFVTASSTKPPHKATLNTRVLRSGPNSAIGCGFIAGRLPSAGAPVRRPERTKPDQATKAVTENPF
ncbi:Uncharacterised protein [Mycobacteroides abscessus subsp. abscessus]|nr:Uncharacterised protein [Mycobacteroides abscessus subsp. abscessus]